MAEFQESPVTLTPDAPAGGADSSASGAITPADLQGGSLMEQLARSESTPVVPGETAPPAPAVEKPAPTTPDAPKPEPATPAEPAAPVVPKWDEVLTGENADAAVAHLAGGKLQTADQLRAALADPTTLLDEPTRALIAHLKSGAKLGALAAVLDQDWAAMSDMDVARAAFDRAHGDLSEDDRDFEWDQYVAGKFPNALATDEEAKNDPAVRSDQRKLKAEADAHRATFTAEQATYRALPTAPDPAAQQAAQQAADAAFTQQWEKDLDAHLQSLTALPITFDGPSGAQTAQYDLGTLSADERQAIAGNFDTMAARWLTPDGARLDPAKVAADLLTLSRQQEIVKLAVAQGRALEADAQIERLRNPLDNPNPQPPSGQSVMQQLAASQPLHAQPSRS